jgi:DNA polymerase-3 subunit alpha
MCWATSGGPSAFSEEQYFKTRAEMTELFADLPEALQNSVEIARRCNLSVELGKNRLPDFPTPNGETIADFLASRIARRAGAAAVAALPRCRRA